MDLKLFATVFSTIFVAELGDRPSLRLFCTRPMPPIQS